MMQEGRTRTAARERRAAPPPTPKPPVRFEVVFLTALFLVLLGSAAIWISRADPDKSGNVAAITGNLSPVIVTNATEPPSTPTPAPTSDQTSPSGPSPAPGSCEPLCLARMQDNEVTDTVLAAYGIKPTYEYESQIWSSVSTEVVQELSRKGASYEIVNGVTDSSTLYVVRLPDWEDESAIGGFGEIVDRVGDQFIVNIPGPPPLIRDLADAGISVEKLPPLLSVNPPAMGEKGPITDPGEVAESISAGQLKRRILDLQLIGAMDGNELGTREYSTPGNVQAAEYLYRRLASFGLNVWYEDFIGDNGRLLLNVVGEIPGRDQSKAYLLTAHFDTIADDTEDQTVAPGALDNASGVSVLLETARVLSQYELEQTVHFAFFNAEEYALQGAHFFADHAVSVANRNYVGAMNVDSVGAALDENQLYVNATEASQWMANLLVEVNDRFGLGVAVWPMQSDKVKADDTELNLQGIPTIMLASVLYGDPLINRSQDTIDQVDVWYAEAVAHLITIAMATLSMPAG